MAIIIDAYPCPVCALKDGSSRFWTTKKHAADCCGTPIELIETVEVYLCGCIVPHETEQAANNCKMCKDREKERHDLPFAVLPNQPVTGVTHVRSFVSSG